MIQSTFKSKPETCFSVLFCSFLLAFISSFFHQKESFLGGALILDHLSFLTMGMILVLALIFSVVLYETYPKERFFRPEIAALFQMTVLGMCLFVTSHDWVSIFVGLEMSSIGFYALVGYINPTRESLEASLKYFILGSFASAFFLFGLALLYSATKTLNLPQMMTQITEESLYFWIEIGSLFLLTGLLFKLAVAPFHAWAPDVYEAAPTGLTGFMATSVKVMILSLLLRMVEMVSDISTVNTFIFTVSFLSFTVGSIMGLSQFSLKRMLAYSSISHGGYMLMALSISNVDYSFGFESLFLYLFAYTITNTAAFSILMWLESKTHSNLTLNDISGLAKKYPLSALGLAICMLSLAGIPPTLGFFGKFFVFFAAVEMKQYIFALSGALVSVISLYFYLRVIVKMYMVPRSEIGLPLAPIRAPLTWVIVGGLLTMLLVFSVMIPGPLFSSIQSSLEDIMMK